jgi:hypothetical protein
MKMNQWIYFLHVIYKFITFDMKDNLRFYLFSTCNHKLNENK